MAIDFRPYGGRWRVSGGLLFGSDHVDRVAQSINGNYVLNGNTYSAANSGTVSSTVSYARPAVYLGVGAGTGILKGLTIAFDAGVVVRNGSSTTTLGTGPLANNAQFRSDVATTTAQFRSHFVQPVASVGLSFRP